MPKVDQKDRPNLVRPVSVDREVSALARLWNRSHPASRSEFLTMAKDAKGDLIEP